MRAVLAEGLALNGDSEGGLRLIEESLTQIARPGWEERWYLAEILRLKGWMLSLQGDLKARSRTISLHSTGHASNRRSPGNYAPRPASRACGNNRASARKLTNCCPDV